VYGVCKKEKALVIRGIFNHVRIFLWNHFAEIEKHITNYIEKKVYSKIPNSVIGVCFMNLRVVSFIY
jgi:hypothetical protein